MSARNIQVPTDEVLETAYRVTETGCWQWTRAINPASGYGLLWRGNRRYIRAHIASYEHHVGPVPDGMVLDHLCRNRACINPGHLEPVSNRVNVLRGEGITAKQARQTHCIHGHPFDKANTWVDKRGRRYCRECKRIRDRASRITRREIGGQS